LYIILLREISLQTCIYILCCGIPFIVINMAISVSCKRFTEKINDIRHLSFKIVNTILYLFIYSFKGTKYWKNDPKQVTQICPCVRTRVFKHVTPSRRCENLKSFIVPVYWNVLRPYQIHAFRNCDKVSF